TSISNTRFPNWEARFADRLRALVDLPLPPFSLSQATRRVIRGTLRNPSRLGRLDAWNGQTPEMARGAQRRTMAAGEREANCQFGLALLPVNPRYSRRLPHRADCR